MSKTKYNIEYQFIDEYKVVDKINVASNQKPIYLNVVDNTVTVDPSMSNYFVVDLAGLGALNFNIVDTEVSCRFEVLLLESVGVREINWADNIIFDDYFYEDLEFKMEEDMRREMLITFKQVNVEGNTYFIGIPTCWFESPSLENSIIFYYYYTSPEGKTPIQNAEVELTGGGYSLETKQTNFAGLAVFSRSRKESYNWELDYENNNYSGTITESEINHPDPVLLEIEL